MTGSAERAPAGKLFERGGEEFSRVLSFSDGLFAIAATLLVVGIAVPTISDADSVGDLADALNDQSQQFVSFAISFAVIGRYWVAHHQMFSLMRAFDRGFVSLNLIYLGFIAFVPFPTALLGEYFDNPLAVTVYATAVGIVSGLEVLLLRHARRAGLLIKEMPDDVYRWGATLSTIPVGLFAISIPVAFIGSGWAVAVWLLNAPAGIYADRHGPQGFKDYFS
ncbi:MAG: TMEM175 family protein [Solirubrobacterales bacterium]